MSEINQNTLEQIAAAHTKFSGHDNREARERAVAQALGCPPPPQPSATATANIGIVSSQTQLLTVVVGNPVNRTFKARDGTGATVSGTLYYRQLWDLTGTQSVTTTFGGGHVTIAIGPINSRAFVSIQPPKPHAQILTDPCFFYSLSVNTCPSLSIWQLADNYSFLGEWNGENIQPSTKQEGTWF
ncbi:hypothetical protein FRC10_005557 [Ceratobasidium sp. 414]|nr:hypothetical protein FRC10_005557 [Ceratobasidium sp. 414]